ncbi:MAG: tyrosine-type recombinase/integrase [Halodesulfurarchaeum sp.]
MSEATAVSGDSKSDADLLDEFLLDAEVQGLTEKTRVTYRSDLKYFIGWLDGDLLDVDRHDLKGFLAHLKNDRKARDGTTGLAPSTLNTYFSALNSCFKYLEWEGYIEENPVPAFRDRYMDNRRPTANSKRQLISIEEMSSLVHSILDPRDRALVLTLAKTGIRRGELVTIDVDDIDWNEQSIKLKDKPKRSNRLVFFDGECAQALRRWMDARSNDNDIETDALFTNQHGTRLQRNSIYRAVTKHAEKVGLHDPDADDLQKRFTPHCFRHWFTTHLRKSGMKREFIKELRGDTRGDAIDIYDHIDREELRQAYLAHIPTLGL